MNPDRPVTLAAVIGAHGVHGAVKLKLFTDDLTRYRHFNGGALTLKSLNGPVAKFAEIGDRDAAQALRGTELTVLRSALPPLAEGEYYHDDLIGLAAISTAGEALGHVVAVENYGAGDILEIERPDGKRVMVPMRADAVPEWGDVVTVEQAFAL